MKHIHFSINFGTLPGHVSVCINNDWEQGLKKIRSSALRGKMKGWVDAMDLIKPDVEFHNKTAAGLAHKETVDGIGYYFLFLKKFDFKNVVDHKILAHELIHLCQYHLPAFFNTEVEHEFFAYTHSHLMQQFYDKAI